MPTGTQDQTTERVTVEDPNRSELEANVSAKMADVFKDGDDTLDVVEEAAKTPEGATEAAAAAQEPKEGEEAAKTEEEPAKAPEAAEKGPAGKPLTTPTNPVIPSAYRRSLKAYQWSDEEIDAAAKMDLAGFMKIAEKTHNTRVAETQRWADMGRHAKTNATPAAVPAETPTFDAKKLREKYGNEPFIDAMEAQHAQLEQAQAFMTQSQQRQQQAEIAQLTKTVDDYFGGKDMEPYHDVYGKSGQAMSPEHTAARTKVLETADLLISGARSMGRSMTLDEALTMAHDSVASPIAAKVAVKKIEKQVQTRQAAISLRPGSRRAAPVPDDRKALEKKVGVGLAAAFGK